MFPTNRGSMCNGSNYWQSDCHCNTVKHLIIKWLDASSCRVLVGRTLCQRVTVTCELSAARKQSKDVRHQEPERQALGGGAALPQPQPRPPCFVHTPVLLVTPSLQYTQTAGERRPQQRSKNMHACQLADADMTDSWHMVAKVVFMVYSR